MKIFVKVDGIDGVSLHQAWKGYHEVESLSWGASNTASAGSATFGGGGKANIQDLNFSKNTDNTSPQMLQKCILGEHISKVEVCFAAGAQQDQKFLTIKLTDVLISSYQLGGAGTGDSLPSDQISMGIGKFEYEVSKLDVKMGKVSAGSKFGYDMKTMKTA